MKNLLTKNFCIFSFMKMIRLIIIVRQGRKTLHIKQQCNSGNNNNKPFFLSFLKNFLSVSLSVSLCLSHLPQKSKYMCHFHAIGHFQIANISFRLITQCCTVRYTFFIKSGECWQYNIKAGEIWLLVSQYTNGISIR